MKRALLILVATILVAILIAGAYIVPKAITLRDRWNQPTDFAAQFVQLNRDHLQLSQGEPGSIQLLTDIAARTQALYREVLGNDNIEPPIFDSRKISFDLAILGEDATPAQLAWREQIIARVEQSDIPRLLDQLGKDPRVLIEPPPGVILYNSLLPDAPLHFLGRVLECQANSAIEGHDPDAAILYLQRLAGLIKAEYSVPITISSLIGTSLEMALHGKIAHIIESGDLSQSHVAALATLCVSIKGPDAPYCVAGEHLAAMELTRASFRDSWLVAKDGRAQLRRLDQVFADRVDRAKRQSAHWANEPDVRPAKQWSALDKSMYPPAYAAGIASDRLSVRAFIGVRTVRDGSRTILAIDRFRADTGHLPDTLAALVPAYLPAIPIDSFANAPLAYRVTAPDQYLLYCVGVDATDNAGTPAKEPVQALTSQTGVDFILYPRN